MASRILEVIFQAKDQASAVIGKAESNIQSSTSKMATAFKVFAASAAALAIGHFLKESVDEALKAEEGMARLGVAVRNAGGNFDQLKPSLERTVDGLVRLTKYTDDDLRAALTNMVTLTGDVAGSQKNLALVADLAAARQIDLGTASDLVSKAMNGTVTGLNKLGFAGKDAETVLKNLGTAVNGFAEKEAQTFGGQLTRLTNQWGEFKEAVGLAIISGDKAGGALGGLTGILASVSDFITENKEAIGSLVNALFAMGEAVWQIVRLPLKGLGIALSAVMDVIGLVMQAIGTLIDKGGSLLAKFGLDFGTSVGASIRDAGIAMQKAAVSAASAIWGVEKKSQDDQTKLVDAGGQARVKLTKQEQADREKAAKDQAKIREQLEEEIWVKSKMLEERLTEKQARELLEREKNLGHSLGVQVTNIELGYQRIDRLNEQLKTAWKLHYDSIAKSTDQLRSPYKSLEAQIAAIDKVSQGAQGTLAKLAYEQDHAATTGSAAADKAAKFNDELRTGVTAATGFASGLGLISASAANLVNQLLAVGTNIGKALTGDVTSIAGVLGGLTGILGTIFGGDKARAEIVRKNTEALRQLTTAVGDFAKLSTPGGKVATAQTFIADFLKQYNAITSKPRAGQSLQDALAEQSAKRSNLLKSFGAQALGAGLSMDDIDQIAKDLGINIRDPKGNVSASGLQSLLTGLGLVEPGFAKTYQGQLDRITKGLGIGAITQGQEFSQLLGAIGIGGENAITRALKGADFSTADGRSAAAGSLRDLFTNIGTLSAADFGGLNQAEFLDAIGRLIEILADPERVIDPVATGTRDQLPLNLSNAFGDLTVAFEDIGTQQVDYLSSIDTNIGQLLTRWTDIDTGASVQLAKAALDVGGITVNVTGATDPAATADAVQRAVSDALNQALADSYLDRQLATGNVTRTVS